MIWRRFAVVVVVGMVLLSSNLVESAATMEQLAKSSEMMRTVCMGKTKPPMDQVEGLGQGKFAEGKEIMCYSNCVLEMMGAMRKGKINADGAIKQVDMLIPAEIGEPTKKAFDICRNAADGVKNNCEAAYALVKCLHKNNPKYFFA